MSSSARAAIWVWLMWRASDWSSNVTQSSQERPVAAATAEVLDDLIMSLLIPGRLMSVTSAVKTCRKTPLCSPTSWDVMLADVENSSIARKRPIESYRYGTSTCEVRTINHVK